MIFTADMLSDRNLMHAKALGYAWGRNDSTRHGIDSALFAEAYANQWLAFRCGERDGMPTLQDAYARFRSHGAMDLS